MNGLGPLVKDWKSCVGPILLVLVVVDRPERHRVSSSFRSFRVKMTRLRDGISTEHLR